MSLEQALALNQQIKQLSLSLRPEGAKEIEAMSKISEEYIRKLFDRDNLQTIRQLPATKMSTPLINGKRKTA